MVKITNESQMRKSDILAALYINYYLLLIIFQLFSIVGGSWRSVEYDRYKFD